MTGGARSALSLFRGVIVAVALVAGRPAVSGTTQSTASDVENGCTGAVSAPWLAGGKTYHVTATASGRRCGFVNLTLTIRTADGRTLLTFASAAADLPLYFAGANDGPAMAKALRRWIEQPGTPRSTRDLPAWVAEIDQPKDGATPGFQPEPLISRENYMNRRRWAQPIFCFLQGADSEGCYALDGKTDTLTLLGTRPPPE